MKRNYELLVVLNYEIPDEDIDSKAEKIKEFIIKEGGDVSNINKWGKRRLAYEIKKSKKGFYLLIKFLSEPHAIKEIGHNLKYMDGIERFMTVACSDSEPDMSGAELETIEEAV